MGSENNRIRKYKSLFIWIVVLLFLLISSSAIFSARKEGNGTNVKQAQKSATSTGVIPSACGIGNATPSSMTTDSALSSISVESTSTPEVSPTPVFYEDFIDNGKGWPVGNASGYTRIVGNNQLVLCATNHRILTESLPTNTTFNNFILTTTFTLVRANSGDSVGVYLRGDGPLDHDYRIDIYENKAVTISKEYLLAGKEYLGTPTPQQSVSLASFSHVAALAQPGRANTLTVTMDGALFTLAVNGVVIGKVADLDYTEGQIALFVNNSKASKGVSATFNHIEVNSMIENTNPNVTPSPSPSNGR